VKILLDENLPIDFAPMLAGYNVTTVQKKDWLGVKNGILLRLAEAEFDIFITADQKLKYQQNLSKRKIAIIVLPTNNLLQLVTLLPKLLRHLPTIKVGDYLELGFK
jgi:hypothetical protein